MKYYGKLSMSSVLKISLDLLMVVGLIMYFFVFRQTLMNNELHIGARVFTTYVLFFIGGIGLFTILFNLRKIVHSLVEVKPFIWENVKALKHIAISCFVIFAGYIGNFIVNFNYIDFKFVEIDLKGVHTDIEFIIFFFAGWFILVLSEVFKQAIKAKEENDFTI